MLKDYLTKNMIKELDLEPYVAHTPLISLPSINKISGLPDYVFFNKEDPEENDEILNFMKNYMHT